MEKKIKEEKKQRQKICPICQRPYEGYGNNPDPLNYRGQVCDECNAYLVIPTRLIFMKYYERLKK